MSLRQEKEKKAIQSPLLELKLMMVFVFLIILKVWTCCIQVLSVGRMGREHHKNKGS